MERAEYEKFRDDGWLKEFGWRDQVDVQKVEREVLNKDGEAKI